MEVVRHSGPRAFLDRAEPWLLRAEDEHNLVLSLAYARAQRTAVDVDMFATVEVGGSVVGCAFCTPPHKLGVTRMPSSAVPLLVEAVTEVYDAIPAVLGPREVSECVAAGWAAARGVAWRAGMRQGIYRLDELTPPPPVPGALRRATQDDLARALEWGEGFGADTGGHFRPPRESVEGWIQRGDLHFWVDSEPVSMAVAQGRTPNGIRVGFVYTPPELRGRGYASACVAELSQRMLDSGLSFCVLYTDLANPTSNGIYRRIGYRMLHEVVDSEILGDGLT